MYWLRDDYGCYNYYWFGNFSVPIGYQAGKVPLCNDAAWLE